MGNEKTPSPVLTSETIQPTVRDEAPTQPARVTPRRSFLKGLGMAGATLTAGALMAGKSRADDGKRGGGKLSKGDIAILRFLAAAEIIESDLWRQYAELGGVTSGDQNAYQLALQQLDGDGSQYISSNTLDEISHSLFLNAYLESKGAPPVNLNKFRTLPSSQAMGAKQIGRLTNLTQLTVDTSFYTRYRSRTNPDFGANFPQAIKLVDLPAIPQKARDAEVLRIVISIGGDEVAHFLEWVDFAGNGVQGPIAPFTDPTNGLTFPDFNATGRSALQTNLIFPVPCEFISPSLPHCAVIRPTEPDGIAAGAVKAFTDDGLFIGQPVEFFDTLAALAEAADEAKRDS